MSDTPLLTHSQYASICESLPDPTFILTESGRYAAILGGKDKRYYHDGSSLVGKRIADVLMPVKTQWFLSQIHAALASQQMLIAEYELSVHDVLGVPVEGPVEPIWFEGRITALDQTYDGERAVVWVASNITGTKQLQRKLHQQAMSDELTGLHNRRSFIQALSQAYASFKHHGKPACLVYLDVDYFKAINDNLGHPAGDQALRDLSAAVQMSIASDDMFCRLGGDEFALLCPGRTMEEITALAQQLLHKGQQALAPFATVGPAPALSLGIAHFQASDVTMQDVMHRADQALYVSKEQGGHQMSITSP
ncbi:MAG: GGDEF domain-containing protein [Comamonas sp.]